MTRPEGQTLATAVDLWVFSLDARGRLSELEGTLAPEERTRADRFAFAGGREDFITGRGLLRTILANYVGATPQSLAILPGTNGKPEFAAPGSQLHFNLSHSGGLAALAVSRTCEVGIDIEHVRPIESGFAERFFSTAENAELASLPEADRLDAVFRCWSRKEAVLKAHGVGLLGDFKSFDVTVGTDPQPRISGLEGPWSLAAFAPAPGYVGAIAARAQAVTITPCTLAGIWPSQA